MYRTNDDYRSEAGILGNAVKGAVAGAIGVWVMDRLDWFLFRHEDPQARRQTEQVRPQGLDPAHVAAGTAAVVLGKSLQPAQPHAAGIAVHYALGVGPAALYAVTRERLPVSSHGQDFLYGIGLGLGLFLVQDEGLNQLLGLSAKQKDYPWQAHARGLAAHVLLGVTINTVLNLLQAPRPRPQVRQSPLLEEHIDRAESGFVPITQNTRSAYVGTMP